MTDKTKKIVKWSGVGAVALGTVAIIVGGSDSAFALKVVEVVKIIIETLKQLI